MSNLHGSDFSLGEPRDIFKGHSGSWVEPAEPSQCSFDIDIVNLEINDCSIATGETVYFDVDQDENGWVGHGSGLIDCILSVSEGVARVCLTHGEITYTGPLPAQSQRGRG